MHGHGLFAIVPSKLNGVINISASIGCREGGIAGNGSGNCRIPTCKGVGVGVVGSLCRICRSFNRITVMESALLKNGTVFIHKLNGVTNVSGFEGCGVSSVTGHGSNCRTPAREAIGVGVIRRFGRCSTRINRRCAVNQCLGVKHCAVLIHELNGEGPGRLGIGCGIGSVTCTCNQCRIPTGEHIGSGSILITGNGRCCGHIAPVGLHHCGVAVPFEGDIVFLPGFGELCGVGNIACCRHNGLIPTGEGVGLGIIFIVLHGRRCRHITCSHLLGGNGFALHNKVDGVNRCFFF